MNSFTINHMIEELYFRNPKFAFGKLGIQLLFLQQLQYYLQMLFVLLLALGIDQNIINKDNYEFVQAPIDKVPVLHVQHQVPNQFETPLVESEEDPASPQEILRESLKLL
ncbi:hypothetical protein Tco_0297535, partial [Tanacetum coccineum]